MDVHRKWSKHKKLFISAPERPRTVLNAFLECMYFDKMTVKTKKLFFSASERPRTVLNAFLECMYFDKMTDVAYTDVAYTDVAYMDVAYGCLYGRRLYFNFN